MKFLFLIFFILLFIYSLLWFSSHKVFPIQYGISFNQNHAASLGLEWKDVYKALLTDLRPEHVRIAAMWSDVEKTPGNFTFEDVDWMMERAAQADVKVILVVGQKAPRWPECHVPQWVNQLEDQNTARDHLFTYIEETVKRYHDHRALELWQVENEPYIGFTFGDCINYQQAFVEEEITFVKGLDPDHKVLVTDSGELSTWRKAIHAGDYFGTTVYRIVRMPGGLVWTYDWFPAAAYRYRAKLWGKNMSDVFVSELQAEPWFVGPGALETSLNEQEKTMNPERLKEHLDFVKRIGAPRAYLWGVEWWYWMKEKQGDRRYWDIIKEEIEKTKTVPTSS